MATEHEWVTRAKSSETSLEEVLAPLTLRQREVISLLYGLRDDKAHTHEEVAEKLGVSKATVRAFASRALQAIRDGERKTTPVQSTALAQLFRARREALGYSRPEVARRTGITESALETYERGVNPRVDTAMMLARFYGISYVDLADAVGVPQAPEGVEVSPAEAITAERMERGWTVERMASELGVTTHEVAAYERGDIEVTASVLARVMRLPGRAQA